MNAKSKGHGSVLRETIHPKVYEIFHPEEKKIALIGFWKECLKLPRDPQKRR